MDVYVVNIVVIKNGVFDNSFAVIAEGTDDKAINKVSKRAVEIFKEQCKLNIIYWNDLNESEQDSFLEDGSVYDVARDVSVCLTHPTMVKV